MCSFAWDNVIQKLDTTYCLNHHHHHYMYSSVQFSHSVMSDSLQPHGGQQHTSFPVHHQLPELAKTYVLWVGDAIQPSHPLSSPSPPAFNLSQHQGLFQWVSSSHQVARSIGVSASVSVLPMNIQDWFLLGWTGLSSLQSKDSQESSPTPQFKSINSLVLSFLYSQTLTSIHD